LEDHSSATTISIINKSKFQKAPFSLAPRRAQASIVAEIEKQFTRLDAATTALKRVQANLKRYRASVLKAACEGRLVPTEAELARKEGRDYEPADKLLQRILRERRARWEADTIAKMQASGKPPTDDHWKQKYKEPTAPDTADLPSLPDGWCWASIEQVSECLDSQRVPINKEERARRGGEVPYYGANGRVGWIDEYLFDEPLVLVVEDETFVGREIPFSYLIRGKSWVNNHAHILRAIEGLKIEFLNYSLAYYPFTPLTTGSTGRRKLTQKALAEAPYALPPMTEQERIVSEIERLLSVDDAMLQSVKTNTTRIERLRQSVLTSAFTGQLVPQDPTDEPASALLERIRAKRGATGPQRPARRSRKEPAHA
jgi:type I restriction enzyme S subunit